MTAPVRNRGKFLKILRDAKRAPSQGPVNRSRYWFQQQAKKVTSVNAAKMFMDMDKTSRGNIKPGEMLLFYYDPKWKKELPYYDTFPLIFPIELYKDRMLGINLHYLPHDMRAQLMDALWTIATKEGTSTERKLKISYEILQSASKFSYFKPCIKMYLYSHLRSQFIKVDSSEWDIALFLPLERFKKASKEAVWKDSRKR